MADEERKPGSELLTPKEVGAILKVSPRSARDYMRRMPHHWIGKHLRISRQALTSWLQRHAATGGDPLPPLRDDRDKHRAHLYENESTGTTKMLAPLEVARELDVCKQLLADLRALSSNSSFSEHGYTLKADPDSHEAQDVVDLILRGTLITIAEEDSDREGETRQFYWQRRTAHYDRLHAEHEARGAVADEPFNMPWWQLNGGR